MLLLAKIKSLLLKNTSQNQTVAKNVFWLSAAELVNKILKVILYFYIARIFGTLLYGQFSFAFNFVGLFAFCSDLSISKIITREFSRDPEKEKDFSSILSLEIFLSVITLVLIVCGSFFITTNEQIRSLIWLLGVYYLINIFPTIFYSFFNARQRMELQSLSNTVSSIVATACALPVLFFWPTLMNLSWSYIFSSVLSLFFVVFLFHVKITKIKVSFDFNIWKKYFKVSWPLILTIVVVSLYSNFDSTMMGYLEQYSQVGLYSAAQKIVSASTIPMGFITLSFFPIISRAIFESKETISKALNKYVFSILFLAVPIFFGGIIIASPIIKFIYGQSFLGSVDAFKILLFSGVLTMITVPYRQLLLAANLLKINLVINLFGALINLSLNFFLIKKYSLSGAVAANLFTSLFFFVTFLVTTKIKLNITLLNIKLMSNFITILFSGISMYIVISRGMFLESNIFLLIMSGALVYIVTFLLLNYIKNFINKLIYEPVF